MARGSSCVARPSDPQLWAHRPAVFTPRRCGLAPGPRGGQDEDADVGGTAAEGDCDGRGVPSRQRCRVGGPAVLWPGGDVRRCPIPVSGRHRDRRGPAALGDRRRRRQMSQSGGRHPGHAVQAEAQAALQQMTNGYWITQIIHVAARLGIADLLDDRPRAIGMLAKSTGTHEPSLHRLMRALTGLGVFKQAENGEYQNTALGCCLVTGSPGALRARAILSGEEWYQGWGRLLETVQTGQTAFDRVFGQPFFEYLTANAEAAAGFNEAMASTTEAAARAVSAAYDFSWANVLVDVGGGTGAFLSTILEANPQTRGVLFDRQETAAAAAA